MGSRSLCPSTWRTCSCSTRVVDSPDTGRLVCLQAMKNAGREEKEVFAEYLRGHGLKRSEQREAILDAFLRSDRHLSVDDLLALVQKKHPEVGRTTVYRTLKLLQQ